MTVQELELQASILDLIARRRSETGDEYLGSAIEQAVLAKALRGIEEEILCDSGALARRQARRRS